MRGLRAYPNNIIRASCTHAGIASLVLAKVHRDSGQKTAERWNWIVEAGLVGIYALANVWIFGPPWLVQWRAVAQLAGYKRLPTSPSSIDIAPMSLSTDLAELRLPPTVANGCEYITLEDLHRGKWEEWE